ncbi:DcaP family trimeric outer membrane transporter [Marinobacter fonticola]|uniref:DcaP family trimeric outer membrane transporter n=1 Tax=Marinobacter fonticola TaxID=2603215 RepID=UPI0011E859EA|nr:DcaP family trimeric outer membrane transporter [Marinobacter fonticola]
MYNNKLFRGSISALALAVASSASALELNVADTKAQLYGYGKLDFIYDVDADLGPLVTHSKIRLDGADGPDGHTNLQAIQSRLGVKTATDTAMGEVKTVIEGDFYGNGGGSFRLRHAYGEWNGLLAGQTWSNFGNFLGTTPTIDFLGQVGQTVIARQTQLRYTTGGLSVALEDPGTLGGSAALLPIAGNPAPDATIENNLPDLTAQYKMTAGAVSLAVSGVARQLSIYNAGNDDEESTFGYGAGLSAKIALSEGLSIQGSMVYGDGIGGYLYGNPGAPAYYDSASGDVEAVTAYGGTLGLSADMGPGSFNLGYGLAQADWDDAEDAGMDLSSQNEQFSSIYANYIWSPIGGVTYGIEAGLHSRETVSGDDGDAVRIQGMAQYSF